MPKRGSSFLGADVWHIRSHRAVSESEKYRWKCVPVVLIQSSYEGDFMANLSGVVQQLKKAHAEAQGEVKRLGAALAALGSLTGRSPARHRRTLSATARRKISLAQKARWAKWGSNAQKGTTRPKRTMSAAARRKIAAAQRARWANVKAGKK